MAGRDNRMLSICCLGYCHAKYLSDAIQSISRIGYDSLEVIVVDDGSSDNSVALLHELSSTVPFDMRVVAQSNTGNIGLNFNTAYRFARGEFVSFISLDDVYHPSVMLRQLQMMLDDTSLAFVASSKTVSIDDDGYVTHKAAQLPLHGLAACDLDGLLELEYTEIGSFYIQSAIFRKDVIDAVGAFDEDMTGDDIVLRTKVFLYLKENAHLSFSILKESSFFYRLHGDNVHRNFPRQVKIITEYLDRFWSQRGNPRLLVGWVASYVSDNNFDDWIRLFSMNSRAASLLSDAPVKSAILLSMKREFGVYAKFTRSIFRREKKSDGKRRVTIFGFLSFEYSKPQKKSTVDRRDGALHHSVYSSY